jgi:hypothetical protein
LVKRHEGPETTAPKYERIYAAKEGIEVQITDG